MIRADHILLKLQEEYTLSFKSKHSGEYCEIFLNPTMADIKEIKCRLVRILIPRSKPDEVYAWDADNALHQEVMNYLNDKYSTTIYSDAEREVFTKNTNIFSRIANLQHYLKSRLEK